MKNILEYSHIEAKRFFLKEESYCNFDLPPYFVFHNLIHKISDKLEGKLLTYFYGKYLEAISGQQKSTYPCDYEDVNYKLLNNKDGKFAWRPFQLVHPAIYVSLVHQISKEENWKFIVNKFKEFNQDPKIMCLSLPVESDNELSDKATMISNWWLSIEQKSIELALEFEYVIHTDISDCYGSIYTHSIVWALHTKETGKRERNNIKLIGNIIDKHLRDMSFGQTNGIPQGSVLMDFIAEMVLGYADLELSERIRSFNLNDYQIIRYRDDYRIFSNNPQDAELIVKIITEICIELGMRLNAQKTFVSNNVVQDSIKADKLYWLRNKRNTKNLQENLLLIHFISQQFPNSGTLNKSLNEFFNRIKNIKETKQNVAVIISILIDIAYKNPKTYPISAAILSKLLNLIQAKEKQKKILLSITKRFKKIPNTGHLQIWLQRITLKIDNQITYEEKLCKKVIDSSTPIWNSDWLNVELKNIISQEAIVDVKILEEINKVIESKEVELFDSKTIYAY